jgi:hypothetical protein
MMRTRGAVRSSHGEKPLLQARWGSPAGAVRRPLTARSFGGAGRLGDGPRTTGWLGGCRGGSGVRSRESACGRRHSAPGTGSALAGAPPPLCGASPVSLMVWALLGWWHASAVRLHLHAVWLMPACSLSPLRELGLVGSCWRRGRWWPWCGGGAVAISRVCGPVEARTDCVGWWSSNSERKLARLHWADGGGTCGRHSPPWRRLRGVFFDLSGLGASSSGESLDPLGRATSFLLWGVALMILLPSFFSMGWTHATSRWMAGDEGFPRGGLRGDGDANERWFGRGNDFGSWLLFRGVRGAFELVFPCCEVGATV